MALAPAPMLALPEVDAAADTVAVSPPKEVLKLSPKPMSMICTIMVIDDGVPEYLLPKGIETLDDEADIRVMVSDPEYVALDKLNCILN